MSDARILQPGATLGDYLIEGTLGSGGSGLVLAATGVSNGKPVALKVLRSVVTGDVFADERERFAREIRTCMALSHPNIVPVIDNGTTEDGILFAAYERVPGDTLRSILERDGPPSFRDTTWLMGQVLRALVYSHSNGVVHRDIKPSNIMVSQNVDMLEARVLDFGVARQLDLNSSSDLTQQGLFLGTSQYACLDQVEGRTPRPAWDLFAWSLVLLETFTGEHPCQSNGTMPWSDDANIEIPDWLRDHELGRLLEEFLLPRKPPDIPGASLLRALEDAGRELNPRIVSAARSRRRLVCVGTCQFSEAEDSEQLVDLHRHDRAVRLCQDASATIVEHLGGRVLSRVGDRLIFGFGYDRGYEDQAIRTVQASLRIVDWVTSQPPATVPLRARIGLHAGQAMLEGKTSDGFIDVAGATPEGASRLGELAAPGDIIASDAIRELLGSSLTLQQLGEVHLPGIRRSVVTYRVDTHTEPDSGLAHSTGFVGREPDMAFLNDLADKARDGKPGAVSVTGEAGMGKSRLLQELRSKTESVWLECHCQQDDSNSPYAPIVLLFDGLEMPVKEILANNGLASEINLGLIGAMLTGDVRPLRGLGISLQRQRELLKDLLVRLLMAIAEREFLVTVIEDLHWADPSTLDVVNQLMTDISSWGTEDDQLRMMVVTTARPSFVAPWAHPVRFLNLERLNDEEISELVSSLRGDLTPEAIRSILRRSEGNPLFAEEITLAGDHLQEDDTSTQPGNLPPVLVQYLAPKLDALSSGAAGILRYAAIIGREMDEPLLKAVSDSSVERFDEALSELTDKGILHRRRTARSTRCVFKHALIRDVVYLDIPETTAPALHDRIATYLVDEHPDEAERRPELIGFHFHAAGKHAQAVDRWVKAIPRLLAVGAYDEAESLGRTALQAVQSIEDENEKLLSQLSVIELLGTAVSSKFGLGVPEVQKIYEPTLEIFERLGSRVPLGVLWGIWSYNIVSQALEEPTGIFIDKFMEAASYTDDPVVIATANSAAGTRRFLLEDVRGSLELFDVANQAKDTAEFKKSVRYHDVGMYTPAWSLSALSLSGEFDRAVAVRDSLLEEARSLSSPSGLSLALAFSLNSYRVALDFDGCIELANENLALCQEQNMIGLMGPAMTSRGWAQVWQGDPEGLQQIREGVNFCDAVGMRLNQVMHKAGLAEALLLLGEIDEAVDVIADALQQSASTIERYQDGELLRLQALANLQLDRTGEAADSFRAAIDRAHGQGVPVSEYKARVAFASLLAEQGEISAAWDLVREIRLPPYRTKVPLFDQLQGEIDRIGDLNSGK